MHLHGEPIDERSAMNPNPNLIRRRLLGNALISALCAGGLGACVHDRKDNRQGQMYTHQRNVE